MIMILKDNDVLKRIIDNSNQYAILSDSINNDLIEFEDKQIAQDYDNSHCTYDFEKVCDGYHGVPNYMHGDILVFDKSNSNFPVLKGIYDKNGLYKMQSVKGTIGYLGNQGKARGICIPQCKFMNSTVLDIYAEHKVYIGKVYSKKSFVELSENKLNEKDIQEIKKYVNQYMNEPFTHLSFDYWCVIGAVYGKALMAWRGVEKINYKKMPLYMTITISEIFETLNPGCNWENLDNNNKYEWKKNLSKIFYNLNEWGMLYDLPCEDGIRKAYCSKSILQNDWIKRRAIGIKEEQRCLQEWGQIWQPFGFKVRLRGSFLFDFCWRKGYNSPSVVQLRPYDYNYKKIFNKKRTNWNKCFSLIWSAWLVQYRNYWIKRKNAYKTCELRFSSKEMKYGFSNSIFKFKTLSTEQMETILNWYSVKKVFESKMKRPAHIEKCYVTKRGELYWELPKNLNDESILLKNEQGINIGLNDIDNIQIPDEVKLAQSRMFGINEENNKHEVLLNGKKIDVNEKVIYRIYSNKIDYTNNGRCYSMKNGVQSLNKQERKQLLIDNHKTVEIDYSALHPNMLYALNNVVFNGKDIYDVGRWYKGYLNKEEARKAVKMMFLRIINAKNKAVAIYSFKKAWNEEHKLFEGTYIPWIYDLYDAINKKHHLINHEFCSGKGTYLMNLDGKLIREVCWRLTREKICVLSVHDSIIVDNRFADKAKRIMQEEYYKIFKKGIVIK